MIDGCILGQWLTRAVAVQLPFSSYFLNFMCGPPDFTRTEPFFITFSRPEKEKSARAGIRTLNPVRGRACKGADCAAHSRLARCRSATLAGVYVEFVPWKRYEAIYCVHRSSVKLLLARPLGICPEGRFWLKPFPKRLKCGR